MKKLLLLIVLVSMVGTVQAVLDGQGDNQTDAFGYYYAITAGKFVNGQMVNGQKDSGGTMAFIYDDPDWGYSYPLGTWNKDGWFAETAGLALTMKNNSSVIYDNFNNDAGDFYSVPAGQPTEGTPGLYRGICMSNNFDWIYAGYFVLTEETTIDQLTGYFDENSGFDADNPLLSYRMNIWSNLDVNVDVDENTSYIQKTPGLDSITGNVFSSDTSAGAFNWGDTGVDRVFGEDLSYATDDIMQLTYTLDAPLTLPAGEYWFSHDAVVPEPATLCLLGLGALVLRRKK